MGRVADAVSGHWVDHGAPEHWRPYLRLMRADRPIGWWLLLLPCWQSLALAIGATGFRWIDLWLPFAFLIGAVAMRGAGCTLNDIVDRKIDAQVERTRSRPLPSGDVSVKQAVVFMAALCLISLVVLLTMNSGTILLAFLSLGIVAVYPFAKRVTDWPQFVLGLAFNWGALVGWAAHTGSVGLPSVLLYIGGIAWTIGYDTIYAHQDKEDDAMIGVKSTALRFGAATPSWLSGFYGAAVLFAGLAGAFAGLGVGFWLGMIAYVGHFVWQLLRLDIDDPDMCLRLFRSNRDAGLILLGAIVLGWIF
jgi:4-hydroxybenzoate polyprenyltransferase